MNELKQQTRNILKTTTIER